MNNWRLVQLDECCEIVSGSTPSTSNAAFWDGDICWATPKDLSNLDGAYISDTHRKLTREGLASCAATILPSDSVLFSSRAPIGHVAVNSVPMATNQGFKSFVPKNDSIHPKFLFHWLRKNRSYLESLGNGATFKEVSKTIVSRIEIPLPPLAEQKRIAAILDMADTIRRKRQAAIKLADDFLRATFLDMFGDPVTNPKGWMVEPLGEHCEEMRYGSSVKCSPIKTENSLPVLRIPNVAKEKVNFEDIVYSSLPKQERTKLKLINGDLLFVRTNGNPDYIGRCAVYKNDTDTIYASYLIRVRLKKDNLLPEYVQACISSKSYRKIIVKEAKTTAGNYNINTQGLRGLKIPIAPLWKQKKYLEINNIVEKQITQKYLGVEYSETLFKSLTQRAFQGEL